MDRARAQARRNVGSRAILSRDRPLQNKVGCRVGDAIRLQSLKIACPPFRESPWGRQRAYSGHMGNTFGPNGLAIGSNPGGASTAAQSLAKQ